MCTFSNKTKLLTVISSDEMGDRILDVMKIAGVGGCTRLFGEAQGKTEDSEFSEPQCILLSIINSDPYKIVNALSSASLQYGDLEITALLFDVFDFDMKILDCPKDTISNNTSNRRIQMEPKMILIAAIVNRIYAEEIMSAARQAGAQGGTIIEARGTGTEEDAIFFGIRLAPEKDIILILSEVDGAPQIVEAIKDQPIFNERGNGIVFTLNIEQSFFFNDKQ